MLWPNTQGPHKFKAARRTAEVYNFFLMSLFLFFQVIPCVLASPISSASTTPRRPAEWRACFHQRALCLPWLITQVGRTHPQGDGLWQTCSLTFEPPLNPFLCSSLLPFSPPSLQSTFSYFFPFVLFLWNTLHPKWGSPYYDKATKVVCAVLSVWSWRQVIFLSSVSFQMSFPNICSHCHTYAEA